MVRFLSRSSLTHTVVGLTALALGLSACTGDTGPGDESELVEALTRDDTFTQAEGECIANAVFSEYGQDEEALKLITRTTDYETLTGDGEGSVAGFGQFFDNAVSGCTGG